MKVRYITFDKGFFKTHSASRIVYPDSMYGFENEQDIAEAIGNEFEVSEVFVLDLQTMTFCEITQKIELTTVKSTE